MKQVKNRIALLFALLIVLACTSTSEKINGKAVTYEVTQQAEDVVFGDNNAPVSVYMYASYFCNYCRYFFSRTLPGLQENYIDNGKVKLVVKWVDFNDDPERLYAMQAASCISRYGLYEKFHPLLMLNPDIIYSEEFLVLIDDIMNDNPEIEACIHENNNYEYLRSNVKAFRANNFTGTPTFVINNKSFTGYISYDNFEKILETEFQLKPIENES